MTNTKSDITCPSQFVKSVIVDRDLSPFGVRWVIYTKSLINFETLEVIFPDHHDVIGNYPDQYSLSGSLNCARELIDHGEKYKGSVLLVVVQEEPTDYLSDGEWMLIENETDAIEAVLRFS